MYAIHILITILIIFYTGMLRETKSLEPNHESGFGYATQGEFTYTGNMP